VDTPAPQRRFDLVAYLKLFRFPLVFTAIADSAAGALIVAGKSGPTMLTLLLLAGASAGLYFFGMSLNDIADRKRDQEVAPGRVIPSGRLSLRSAILACAGALIVSLACIALVRETPLVWRLAIWAMTVVFIVSYNVFLKIPPAMGLVRVGNLVLGMVAAYDFALLEPRQWIQVLKLGLPEFIYVSALTYVSTLEDGAVGRRRLAVGCGLMVIGGGLASFILPLAYQLEFLTTWNPFIVVRYVQVDWRATLLSGLLGCWILRRAWKAVDKKGVMLLVRDGVGGIILLDASLLASSAQMFDMYAFYVPFLIAALIIPSILSVAIFKKLA
jgi:4-hydroxybenzoate polyprenyltransferase